MKLHVLVEGALVGRENEICDGTLEERGKGLCRYRVFAFKTKMMSYGGATGAVL